ncbi:MAG TPA: hypothetical protein VIJ68_00620 [Candidatus Saccharimonadales bacterium]
MVRDKWLIFDADAIITIIEFRAQDLFVALKELNCNFTYIHPVLLELMNTDTAQKRLQRGTLLSEHEFTQLTITQAERDLSDRIQKSLPLGVKSKPSATDFYLAGTLAKYGQSQNAVLLTSNTKDFPLPIFPRLGFINLQNTTDVKAVSILGVDMSKVLD